MEFPGFPGDLLTIKGSDRTWVLDIESRLLDRMKSRGELLDPTMARDEHDLAITWHETPLR